MEQRELLPGYSIMRDARTGLFFVRRGKVAFRVAGQKRPMLFLDEEAAIIFAWCRHEDAKKAAS